MLPMLSKRKPFSWSIALLSKHSHSHLFRSNHPTHFHHFHHPLSQTMQTGPPGRIQRNVAPLYDPARLSRKPSYRQPHASYDASLTPITGPLVHSVDPHTQPPQHHPQNSLHQPRKERLNYDSSQLSRKPSTNDISFQQPLTRSPSAHNLPQPRKHRSVSPLYDQSKLSHKSSFRQTSAQPAPDASLSRKSSFRYPSDEAKQVSLQRSSSRNSVDRNPAHPHQKLSFQLQAPTDDASLKRTYSQRVQPTFATKPASHKPSPSDDLQNEPDDADAANVRRLSSLKPGRRRLTVEEREERRRVRNRENSRRIRERQRQEQRAMERIYDVNEARIKELEKAVDELSSELRRSSTISPATVKREPTQTSRKDNKGAFKVPEERPGWFGDSF